jgi:hypothetical protein
LHCSTQARVSKPRKGAAAASNSVSNRRQISNGTRQTPQFVMENGGKIEIKTQFQGRSFRSSVWPMPTLPYWQINSNVCGQLMNARNWRKSLNCGLHIILTSHLYKAQTHHNNGGITLCPLSFRTRSFRPGHFVPSYISSPVSLSLVISSPGHFVP